MDLEALFKNKEIKAKDKTFLLSKELLAGNLSLDTLLDFAAQAKDPVKAVCTEATEFATKTKPEIASDKLLHFVTENLTSKAGNVKWESAKVIGNIARIFPDKLDMAITNLLANTEDTGTVVRWSAAFALGKILKLQTAHNKNLRPALETISNLEEKNSIRKIYLDALKKTAV